MGDEIVLWAAIRYGMRDLFTDYLLLLLFMFPLMVLRVTYKQTDKESISQGSDKRGGNEWHTEWMFCNLENYLCVCSGYRFVALLVFVLSRTCRRELAMVLNKRLSSIFILPRVFYQFFPSPELVIPTVAPLHRLLVFCCVVPLLFSPWNCISPNRKRSNRQTKAHRLLFMHLYQSLYYYPFFLANRVICPEMMSQGLSEWMSRNDTVQGMIKASLYLTPQAVHRELVQFENVKYH